MSPLRLQGATSGYSQLDAPAVAGDQTFTLPGTGGILDRLNRAGNVLQVVSASTSTQVTATSTYVDTGLSASITPSSSTSTILVVVNQHMAFTGSNAGGGYRLLRDGTVIHASVANTDGPYAFYVQTSAAYAYQTVVYRDSPATTSALAYKTQGRAYLTGTAYFQLAGTVTNATSYIYLLEIAG